MIKLLFVLILMNLNPIETKSILTEFHADSVKATEKYIDNTKEGEVKTWYVSGKVISYTPVETKTDKSKAVLKLECGVLLLVDRDDTKEICINKSYKMKVGFLQYTKNKELRGMGWGFELVTQD